MEARRSVKAVRPAEAEMDVGARQEEQGVVLDEGVVLDVLGGCKPAFVAGLPPSRYSLSDARWLRILALAAPFPLKRDPGLGTGFLWSAAARRCLM